MNRLPKRFEKEVLVPVGIKWKTGAIGYIRDTMPKYDFVQVDPYEIAARGLEAMKKGHASFFYHEENCSVSIDVYDIFETDEDFCTCVFKAIEEVYGE